MEQNVSGAFLLLRQQGSEEEHLGVLSWANGRRAGLEV